MLPETILLPKSIKDAEDRFIIKVKEEFQTIIKEVNRLEKRIATIKEFTGLEDLLDKIRGKANIDASNVGQNGDVDTTGLWGEALGAGEVREIDNKLVNGSTVYKEVRPPGMLIAYNYIAEQKTTADNLISLDTKLKEVDDEVKAIVMPTFDTSGLATVDLANINYAAESKINGIVRSSIEIKPAENSNMTITKVLEGHQETYYLKAHGGGTIPNIYAYRHADNVGQFYKASDDEDFPYYSTNWEELIEDGHAKYMLEWGMAVGSNTGVIKHKRQSSDTELHGDIGAVLPHSYQQEEVEQISMVGTPWGTDELPINTVLASVRTVAEETRSGYANRDYIQNDIGWEHGEYAEGDLCFIDSCQSAGYAINSLHEALIEVTEGLHTLWSDIHGYSGKGSPYYPENSEYLPEEGSEQGYCIDKDILEIQQAIRIINTNIDNLQDDVDYLSDKIENHETRIAALEELEG